MHGAGILFTAGNVMTQASVVLRPVQVTAATLLALHAQYPERYPALLESVSGGELGRYDILFAFPGERLTLYAGDRLIEPGGDESHTRFLDVLDTWWQQVRTPTTDAPAFSGGWLVYLGYELAGQIEQRLNLNDAGDQPIAQAIRMPAAIIRDHGADTAWVIAEAESAALLDSIQADLEPTVDLSQLPVDVPLLSAQVSEEPPQRYLDAVARALEYIAAGDVYQTNLSRAWTATLADAVAPHHLYQRLRATNPGPFAAIALLDQLAIVSSSPERLVSVRAGWVDTRPIAGTRPRSGDPSSDRDLASELRANPKEQAEHVMLIDLERNDLGRVCEAGTVEVNEFMTIESYAHVHHIVSNVRGRLRADVTPGQVLAAVFPGGTITGCPKVRCMQIIAELEHTARGAYTGSLGYLNRDGSMDFNILIRSLQINAGSVTLRAGAGIVADSVPERELAETRAKARGVLRALSSSQFNETVQ
jgi:anthranilate synthase component 1